jgi:hypothetical protein
MALIVLCNAQKEMLYSKDSGIEAEFVKVRFPEKSVEM